MIDRKIQQARVQKADLYTCWMVFVADHLLSLAFVFLRVCGLSIKNRKAEQIELTRCSWKPACRLSSASFVAAVWQASISWPERQKNLSDLKEFFFLQERLWMTVKIENWFKNPCIGLSIVKLIQSSYKTKCPGILQGSLNYPFLGDQTMQIYRDFQGIHLVTPFSLPGKPFQFPCWPSFPRLVLSSRDGLTRPIVFGENFVWAQISWWGVRKTTRSPCKKDQVI